MKEGIHPVCEEVTVTCSCGNSFMTQSTKACSHIEVCSKCHPAYTGVDKKVGTAGKVEQYKNRFGNRGIGGVKTAPAA